MIQLLRKSIELLRENPILWLPFLIADLLTIGLWRLWGIVRRVIFHWFTTRHSVLGGEVPVPSTDHSALTNASLANLPIGLAAVIAVVCLFVAALSVTATMVDVIGREQNLNAKEVLAGVIARWRKILLLGVTFLVLIAAFAAAVLAPVFFVLYRVHRPDLLTSPLLAPVAMFVVVGCSVWLIMPATIRLICADREVLDPSRTRVRGAIMAIIASEAGALLGLILSKAETAMRLETQLGWSVLSAFNSVVANAPDVLLFITLALLAAESSRAIEDGKRSRVRELLQALMPMDFRQTKEPE